MIPNDQLNFIYPSHKKCMHPVYLAVPIIPYHITLQTNFLLIFQSDINTADQ